MGTVGLGFLASAFGWLPAVRQALTWKYSLIAFILIGVGAGVCMWAAVQRFVNPSAALNKRQHGTTEAPAPTTFPSVRVAYSSRQVLQISNVPGDYNRALNLDNVATLRLSVPFSRESVTLLWPTSPPTTIEEPGATTRNLSITNWTTKITFDVTHPVQLIRVGERIFRVSLEDIHDKTTPERIFWFQYEFAISEVEPNAENRAAAITQKTQ
jgi:hypothetical protein